MYKRQIDDIDSILSLPVIETKIPTKELELYKKILQLPTTMMFPDIYLKGMGTQKIRVIKFTMENGITENYYSRIRKFIDQGIRPISLGLYNRSTKKEFEMEIDEFLEKVQFEPSQELYQEQDQNDKSSAQENPIETEKWLKLLELENKKLDLSSLGQKNGFVASFVFDDEEVLGYDAEFKIENGNVPKSIRIGNEEKDFFLNISNIDEILSLPVIPCLLYTSDAADD